MYAHKGAEWVGVGGWTSQDWDASLGGKPVAVSRKRCTGCDLLVKSLASHWDDLLEKEGISFNESGTD